MPTLRATRLRMAPLWLAHEVLSGRASPTKSEKKCPNSRGGLCPGSAHHHTRKTLPVGGWALPTMRLQRSLSLSGSGSKSIAVPIAIWISLIPIRQGLTSAVCKTSADDKIPTELKKSCILAARHLGAIPTGSLSCRSNCNKMFTKSKNNHYALMLDRQLHGSRIFQQCAYASKNPCNQGSGSNLIFVTRNKSCFEGKQSRTAYENDGARI
jgi:hypothetical protein